MNGSGEKRLLVLGYGNPGRGDDGLGPAFCGAIEALALPGVAVDANYQLNIEDAASLAGYSRVLFVDASKNAADSFEFWRIAAAPRITFTTHSVSPESVLAICETHFGTVPDAWLLGIRGYEFDFAEELTPAARENLDRALSHVVSWIGDWKE